MSNSRKTNTSSRGRGSRAMDLDALITQSTKRVASRKAKRPDPGPWPEPQVRDLVAPFMGVGKRYLKNRILDFPNRRGTKLGRKIVYVEVFQLPFGTHEGQRWSSDGSIVVPGWPKAVAKVASSVPRGEGEVVGEGMQEIFHTGLEGIYDAFDGEPARLGWRIDTFLGENTPIDGLVAHSADSVHVFDSTLVAAALASVNNPISPELWLKDNGRSGLLGIRGRDGAWAIVSSLTMDDSLIGDLQRAGLAKRFGLKRGGRNRGSRG